MELYEERHHQAKEYSGGCARTTVQLRGIHVALHVSKFDFDPFFRIGFVVLEP